MNSIPSLFHRTEIIIHHSDTIDDAGRQDWPGICKFHTSWRFEGEIITEKKAKELISADKKGVIPPWRMVGYNGGLELVDGKIVYQPGRPFTMPGAHCEGHNISALGLCCVGDFDKEPPSEIMYQNAAIVCVGWMKAFPLIKPSTIYPHSKFSPKTCPGKEFDMERLIKYVVKLGGME
jgi:hypothetical protein